MARSFPVFKIKTLITAKSCMHCDPDEDLRYQDIAEDKKYKTTTISEFVEDATNFQVAGVTTRQPRRGLADEHPLVQCVVLFS
jgi:hypothetical protein